MSILKIRENDYYKYGVELPLLIAAFTNAVTTLPLSCSAPVLVAGISAYTSYTSEKEGSVKGNPLSRLFNFASGVTCGVIAGIGLDGLAQDYEVHNYLTGTASDTLAALITYTSTRLCGRALASKNQP